jgi:isoquinoline 1-oxidoreductase subunit beta
MDRRRFVMASVAASGALLVGCSPAERQQLRSARLSTVDGQVALNGWIKLGTDGLVTVVCGKSEMGQGAHTALMMIVADELGAAWPQMRIEHGPVDKLYGNIAAIAEGIPFRGDDDGVLARSMRWVMHRVAREMGFMMTGGSASVRDLFDPLRQAAAISRATLVQAAATAWQLPADAISLRDGRLQGPAGQAMSLGDAVKGLGSVPQPATRYTLKAATDYQIIGKPTKRHDAVAKVQGASTFGIDVRLPGLLHAAVKMAPQRGASVQTHDASRARALPGVKAVVSFPADQGGTGGVAVVADHPWRARKALDAVDATWAPGPMAGFSSATGMKTLASALDTDDGFGFWKRGDVEAALASAPTTLEAEYRAPWLAHGTLEPMNATARLADGKGEIWAPTQVAGFARRAAAKAFGIDEDAVTVHVTQLGGGFGRRLETDFIAQAAHIARQVPGVPVQVLWSREDDTRHDFYRPAGVARLRAGLDAQGRLVAWRCRSAGQSIVAGYMPRNAGMPAMGPDKTTAEGLFDQPYDIPAVRVGQVKVALPVPVGFWRGVGHSHNAFFTESFIDECAHAAKADPVAFRLALLHNRPRHKAVLELVAERSGWAKPLPPAADGAKQARGVALHESFGSVVAQVAEVSLAADRSIRVHRVVCAVDCGFVVNPNGVAQQMESAVAFGLGAALFGQVDIEDGVVKPGNFHEFRPLRFSEAPLRVETHLVASREPPEGVGEPGLPPIAPAVANAVFALSGQRLRSLPLSLAANAG